MLSICIARESLFLCSSLLLDLEIDIVNQAMHCLNFMSRQEKGRQSFHPDELNRLKFFRDILFIHFVRPFLICNFREEI